MSTDNIAKFQRIQGKIQRRKWFREPLEKSKVSVGYILEILNPVTSYSNFTYLKC